MSVVAPQQEAKRFVEKWSASDLSEWAASHEQFIEVCRLVGQPAPAEANPTDQNNCFKKAVKDVAASKDTGEGGFVDVCKRGFFACEYKRTRPNCYNERPQWLKLAHEKAAYAATDAVGNWSEDWATVWSDTGAGQPLPEDQPLAAERKPVDLANDQREASRCGR